MARSHHRRVSDTLCAVLVLAWRWAVYVLFAVQFVSSWFFLAWSWAVFLCCFWPGGRIRVVLAWRWALISFAVQRVSVSFWPGAGPYICMNLEYLFAERRCAEREQVRQVTEDAAAVTHHCKCNPFFSARRSRGWRCAVCRWDDTPYCYYTVTTSTLYWGSWPKIH